MQNNNSAPLPPQTGNGSSQSLHLLEQQYLNSAESPVDAIRPHASPSPEIDPQHQYPITPQIPLQPPHLQLSQYPNPHHTHHYLSNDPSSTPNAPPQNLNQHRHSQGMIPSQNQNHHYTPSPDPSIDIYHENAYNDPLVSRSGFITPQHQIHITQPTTLPPLPSPSNLRMDPSNTHAMQHHCYHTQQQHHQQAHPSKQHFPPPSTFHTPTPSNMMNNPQYSGNKPITPYFAPPLDLKLQRTSTGISYATPAMSLYHGNHGLFSGHDTRTIAQTNSTSQTNPFRNDQYQILIKQLFDQLCKLSQKEYYQLHDYHAMQQKLHQTQKNIHHIPDTIQESPSPQCVKSSVLTPSIRHQQPIVLAEPCVKRYDLLQFLSNHGIQTDDPRVTDTMRCIFGGPPFLNWEQFSLLLSNDFLIRRAIQHEFVIPNFPRFTAMLTDIFYKVSTNETGAVATYIPQLANVSPHHFGLGVCTIDGQRFHLGSDDAFCIQSCSKPSTYCSILQQHGVREVHRHLSKEASGRGFNERILTADGMPHNPMINSGAIMSASLFYPQLSLDARFDKLVSLWKRLSASNRVTFDNATYLSERRSADRNFSLAHMLNEAGTFHDGTNLVEVLELYFMQCSIELTCSMMSVVAATFANLGVNPITNETIFEPHVVRHMLSLLFSAGMYDASGEIAYTVGFPIKSGVSGVVMMVIPGKMGICTWSPRLDPLGNSVRGTVFCKEITRMFDLHIYSNVTFKPPSPMYYEYIKKVKSFIVKYKSRQNELTSRSHNDNLNDNGILLDKSNTMNNLNSNEFSHYQMKLADQQESQQLGTELTKLYEHLSTLTTSLPPPTISNIQHHLLVAVFLNDISLYSQSIALLSALDTSSVTVELSLNNNSLDPTQPIARHQQEHVDELLNNILMSNPAGAATQGGDTLELIRSVLDTISYDGFKLIEIACIMGHIEMISLLLIAGVDTVYFDFPKVMSMGMNSISYTKPTCTCRKNHKNVSKNADINSIKVPTPTPTKVPQQQIPHSDTILKSTTNNNYNKRTQFSSAVVTQYQTSTVPKGVNSFTDHDPTSPFPPHTITTTTNTTTHPITDESDSEDEDNDDLSDIDSLVSPQYSENNSIMDNHPGAYKFPNIMTTQAGNAVQTAPNSPSAHINRSNIANGAVDDVHHNQQQQQQQQQRQRPLQQHAGYFTTQTIDLVSHCLYHRRLLCCEIVKLSHVHHSPHTLQVLFGNNIHNTNHESDTDSDVSDHDVTIDIRDDALVAPESHNIPFSTSHRQANGYSGDVHKAFWKDFLTTLLSRDENKAKHRSLLSSSRMDQSVSNTPTTDKNQLAKFSFHQSNIYDASFHLNPSPAMIIQPVSYRNYLSINNIIPKSSNLTKNLNYRHLAEFQPSPHVEEREVTLALYINGISQQHQSSLTSHKPSTQSHRYKFNAPPPQWLFPLIAAFDGEGLCSIDASRLCAQVIALGYDASICQAIINSIDYYVIKEDMFISTEHLIQRHLQQQYISDKGNNVIKMADVYEKTQDELLEQFLPCSCHQFSTLLNQDHYAEVALSQPHLLTHNRKITKDSNHHLCDRCYGSSHPISPLLTQNIASSNSSLKCDQNQQPQRQQASCRLTKSQKIKMKHRRYCEIQSLALHLFPFHHQYRCVEAPKTHPIFEYLTATSASSSNANQANNNHNPHSKNNNDKSSVGYRNTMNTLSPTSFSQRTQFGSPLVSNPSGSLQSLLGANSAKSPHNNSAGLNTINAPQHYQHIISPRISFVSFAKLLQRVPIVYLICTNTVAVPNWHSFVSTVKTIAKIVTKEEQRALLLIQYARYFDVTFDEVYSYLDRYNIDIDTILDDYNNSYDSILSPSTILQTTSNTASNNENNNHDHPDESQFMTSLVPSVSTLHLQQLKNEHPTQKNHPTCVQQQHTNKVPHKTMYDNNTQHFYLSYPYVSSHYNTYHHDILHTSGGAYHHHHRHSNSHNHHHDFVLMKNFPTIAPIELLDNFQGFSNANPLKDQLLPSPQQHSPHHYPLQQNTSSNTHDHDDNALLHNCLDYSHQHVNPQFNSQQHSGSSHPSESPYINPHFPTSTPLKQPIQPYKIGFAQGVHNFLIDDHHNLPCLDNELHNTNNNNNNPFSGLMSNWNKQPQQTVTDKTSQIPSYLLPDTDLNGEYKNYNSKTNYNISLISNKNSAHHHSDNILTYDYEGCTTLLLDPMQRKKATICPASSKAYKERERILNGTPADPHKSNDEDSNTNRIRLASFFEQQVVDSVGGVISYQDWVYHQGLLKCQTYNTTNDHGSSYIRESNTVCDSVTHPSLAMFTTPMAPHFSGNKHHPLTLLSKPPQKLTAVDKLLATPAFPLPKPVDTNNNAHDQQQLPTPHNLDRRLSLEFLQTNTPDLSQIPQLQPLPPQFSLSICTVTSQKMEFGGDTTHHNSQSPHHAPGSTHPQKTFCVRSLFKIINYCIVQELFGEDFVHQYVGKEPSGTSADEVTLDHSNNPHNPYINSGAIMCCALLLLPDLTMSQRFDLILGYWKRMCGITGKTYPTTMNNIKNDDITYNIPHYLYEKENSAGNYCLAFLIKNKSCFPKEHVKNHKDVDSLIDLYSLCCSIQLTSSQLSIVSATLSNGGINPITGEAVFSPRTVRNALSIMATCGLYNFAGQFSFYVGLPSKSSTDGILMVCVPGLMGLCLSSPVIDENGLSIIACRFIFRLSKYYALHIYDNNYDSLTFNKKRNPRDNEHVYSIKIVQLLCAAKNNDIFTIMKLLKQGVNPNACDGFGRTALHIAVQAGSIGACSILLQAGANPHIFDINGRLPNDIVYNKISNNNTSNTNTNAPVLDDLNLASPPLELRPSPHTDSDSTPSTSGPIITISPHDPLTPQQQTKSHLPHKFNFVQEADLYSTGDIFTDTPISPTPLMVNTSHHEITHNSDAESDTNDQTRVPALPSAASLNTTSDYHGLDHTITTLQPEEPIEANRHFCDDIHPDGGSSGLNETGSRIFDSNASAPTTLQQHEGAIDLKVQLCMELLNQNANNQSNNNHNKNTEF